MPKALLFLLLAPFLQFLYWISGFVPRRSRHWVFGSYNNSFTDNAKFLYIHLVEQNPGVDVTWISSNSEVVNLVRASGGSAFKRWSLQGILKSLSAEYWFVSAYTADINHFCSRGAKVVNLWHGIPLKKIEFDIERGPLAARYKSPSLLDRHVQTPWYYRKPDFVLSTSEVVSKSSFAGAFRISEDQCLNFGYPRTDHFFYDEARQKALIDRWEPESTKKIKERIRNHENIYLYMPTWRDSNPNFLLQSGLDFLRLNGILERNNSILIIKLHPATPAESTRAIPAGGNIIVFNSTADIYPILAETTALITDYSSIAYDYLLLNKPLYFYPFDYDAYRSDSRGLYHNYEEFAPGVILRSAEEVEAVISDPPEDAFESARKSLKDRLFAFDEGGAARRLTQAIFLLDQCK